MPCATPCKNCDRKGLPILFTRYAAAYSGQTKGMTALKPFAPAGQFQAKPSGVDMKTAQYNVRMLRPGYLYVRIESNCRAPKWYGYIVHPHGYLAEFPVDAPESAKPTPACEVEIRGSIASMVWVEDAKSVMNFNFMFHPDPIDYQHLKSEIEPNLGKYTQSFDVADWFNGSTGQKNTCTPALLNAQVVEFAGLENEALRDAIEPQMYGLMGANPQERGWGNYENVENRPIMTGMGASGGREVVAVTVKGPTYLNAHGKRLKKIAEMLQDKKGAVVACEDAIGISQELGHLQSQAQVGYAAWQDGVAAGFGSGVSNEWVLQTAVNAQSMRTLVTKGALQAIQDRFDTPRRLPELLPSRDLRERETEIARASAARERNRGIESSAVIPRVEAAYGQFFNQTAANTFLNDEHAPAYKAAQALRARLGEDQCKWLTNAALFKEMDCYSAQDSKIDKLGGGAALSLELAQCMAGTECNESGQNWLQGLDLWGNNAFARAMCFNNKTFQATLKQAVEVGADTAAARVLPDPDPNVSVLEKLSLVLKVSASQLALGDKALAFINAAAAPDAGRALRIAAWPVHIVSFVHIKMTKGIEHLPVSEKGARLVRHMALAGLSTLGNTVAKEAERLQLDADDIKRMRARANKLGELSMPQKGKTGQAAVGRAKKAAPGTRMALFAGLFDIGAGMLKFGQLTVNPDGRTAVEMGAQVLQGIGSIVDYKAKAYELTIYKGIKGVDVYKQKAVITGLDALNVTHLRSLQKMAFKWLGPAAMVSVWFDGVDANRSFDREQYALGSWQIASVFGTVFTIASTAVVAFDLALLGVAAETLGVVFGFIGVALVVTSVVAIAVLKEEEWVNWLTDCPLNKSKKPNHKDLEETQQKFFNVRTELQPAS